jgi:hypothetical protein
MAALASRLQSPVSINELYTDKKLDRDGKDGRRTSSVYKKGGFSGNPFQRNTGGGLASLGPMGTSLVNKREDDTQAGFIATLGKRVVNADQAAIRVDHGSRYFNPEPMVRTDTSIPYRKDFTLLKKSTGGWYSTQRAEHNPEGILYPYKLDVNQMAKRQVLTTGDAYLTRAGEAIGLDPSTKAVRIRPVDAYEASITNRLSDDSMRKYSVGVQRKTGEQNNASRGFIIERQAPSGAVSDTNADGADSVRKRQSNFYFHRANAHFRQGAQPDYEHAKGTLMPGLIKEMVLPFERATRTTSAVDGTSRAPRFDVHGDFADASVNASYARVSMTGLTRHQPDYSVRSNQHSSDVPDEMTQYAMPAALVQNTTNGIVRKMVLGAFKPRGIQAETPIVTPAANQEREFVSRKQILGWVDDRAEHHLVSDVVRDAGDHAAHHTQRQAVHYQGKWLQQERFAEDRKNANVRQRDGQEKNQPTSRYGFVQNGVAGASRQGLFVSYRS